MLLLWVVLDGRQHMWLSNLPSNFVEPAGTTTWFLILKEIANSWNAILTTSTRNTLKILRWNVYLGILKILRNMHKFIFEAPILPLDAVQSFEFETGHTRKRETEDASLRMSAKLPDSVHSKDS